MFGRRAVHTREEHMELTQSGAEINECRHWLEQLGGNHLDQNGFDDFSRRIQEHKWYLSEKLGRDVGCKVAALDLLENGDPVAIEVPEIAEMQVLKAFGGRKLSASTWETISESQPPKQIVNRRIILPLLEIELARKHAVQPPRTILFFGPPGTGKTHFVQAIAGILQWWFIELSPSMLLVDGQDRQGTNLKRFMEGTRHLDEAVLFIDEFEELAASRDQASHLEKSITNEFLKQVPLFKDEPRKNLLVCATNYIRQLDAALLRPGRFDCIIPVGGLDDQSRRTIFNHFLRDTNCSDVDVERIIAQIPLFTPADIEYLFSRVRQAAFENEHVQGNDFRVDTEMFLEIIGSSKPSLTDEMVAEFEQDCEAYTRY
jgi:transitional endoplasmic reticulum ATPase